VAALFNTAYVTAATVDKCVSGFEQSGTHPFNRHRISDFRFAPSITTDNSAACESSCQPQQQQQEISEVEESTQLVTDPQGIIFDAPLTLDKN